MDFRMIAAHKFFDIPSRDDIAGFIESLIAENEEVGGLSALILENDERDFKETLWSALKELGVSMPSHKEAGYLAAKHIAEKIINGEIRPYDGAKKIWFEIQNHEGEESEFDDLINFVGHASNYEDMLEKESVEFYGGEKTTEIKQEIEKDIVVDAQELIDAMNQSGDRRVV